LLQLATFPNLVKIEMNIQETSTEFLSERTKELIHYTKKTLREGPVVDGEEKRVTLIYQNETEHIKLA
jgi:hypothetical protein